MIARRGVHGKQEQRSMSQFPPPPPELNPGDFAPIGTPVGPGTPLPQKPRANGWAITSLVCGLLGCVPFATGAIAVITGIVGLKKANDPRYGGRGLAIGGLVLGAISIVCWGLFGSAILALFWGTGVPRQLAQDFVKMTRDGAVDAALQHAAPNIRREELERLSQQMQPWGDYVDVTSYNSSIRVDGGQTMCELKGTATFSEGEHPFAMTLVKQGDTWKVSGLEFD
jgi:hypothetical protein